MLCKDRERLLGLYNAISGKLELLVRVLNINSGYNEGLKKQCRTLKEYMQYVEKVCGYAKSMPTTEAVDKAVEECIRQDILKRTYP